MMRQYLLPMLLLPTVRVYLALISRCVPLMILDPVVPAIGLAHAGWKGTVLRIGAKTIKMMEGRAPGKDCLVRIGPSIGPCCHEVGEQVLEEIKSSYVDGEIGEGTPRRTLDVKSLAG